MSTKVKICGLKTPDSIKAAVKFGAAYLGFNHYPPSPRFISLEQMTTLSALVPASVKKVSLTVDAEHSLLDSIIATYSPDFLQFHGKESPDDVAKAKADFGLPIIKAVSIETKDDINQARRYENVCDILLFDAKPPKSLANALPGGNAISFDWSLLAGEDWQIPWMLSGGLSPENVAEAIEKTGATMVDVSSGVESQRGQKDASLIKAFLDRAKQG